MNSEHQMTPNKEESMKPKVSEWEKEFDSKYLVLEQWTGLNAGSPPVDLRNDVKAFIQQTLDQQKAEFVKLVRGLKVGIGHPTHVLDLARRNGYNQAIDEAISIIKRYMK